MATQKKTRPAGTTKKKAGEPARQEKKAERQVRDVKTESPGVRARVKSYTRTGHEGGLCLECGDALPYGRADKKFCSVKCKSRYNYVSVRVLENMKASVKRALNRNHDILEQLIEQGVASIDIPDLVQMGYKPDCITSYHKVRNHNEYRCYDIKYYMSESRVFGISKRTPAERRWKKDSG